MRKIPSSTDKEFDKLAETFGLDGLLEKGTMAALRGQQTEKQPPEEQPRVSVPIEEDDDYIPGGPFTALFGADNTRRYCNENQQIIRPVTGSPISFKHKVAECTFKWTMGVVGEVYATSFEVLTNERGSKGIHNVAVDDPWRFLREEFAIVSLVQWVNILTYGHYKDQFFPGWKEDPLQNQFPPLKQLQVENNEELLEKVLLFKRIDLRANPRETAFSLFDDGLKIAGMVTDHGVWRWP